MKNVKIYDIKTSAASNYEKLKSANGKYFYWNDAKFLSNKIGDIVFFVNRIGREALFTKLHEKAITASFMMGNSQFRHDGHSYEVPGNFESFVQFQIVERVRIPQHWHWEKPLQQKETYDLWREDGKLDKPQDRFKKVDNLINIFGDGEAFHVLQQCRNLLNNMRFSNSQREQENTPILPFNSFITVADNQTPGKTIKSDATQFSRAYKTSYKGLSVKISFGKSNASYVPWIAFLHKGQSVQNGIYPVLLYYRSKKLLILSFGVSETNQPSFHWPNEESLQSVENYFNTMGYDKPERYEDSFVFKAYSTKTKVNEATVQNDLNELIAIYDTCFENELEPTVSEDVDAEIPNKMELSTTISTIPFKHELRRAMMAIKTKPFLLLAGLSGIGKSRLARTIAFKTCALKSLRSDSNPGNFQLIQVKPNWHDSSELLGYESNISESPKYIVTPFIKFLLKALRNPGVPFILCLDEMNLAPVEQYFAEFLSAIESRRRMGSVLIADPLIPPDVFYKFSKSDEFRKDLQLDADSKIFQSLMQHGLSIPQNLIVIGTVNMDETTHSFSRKVLDRAMTIEMNQVNLMEGLKETGTLDWSYPDEYYSIDLVCGLPMLGKETFGQFQNSDDVITRLDDINLILKITPFRVAYRVRDEALAYCYYHSKLAIDKDASWLKTILDEIVLMKVLPRIEGDETMCKKPLEKLADLFKENSMPKCAEKAHEMLLRLGSGYTSYF